MVASATSAVMILYTSFTATTSFMVFGLLEASDMSKQATLFVLITPSPPPRSIAGPLSARFVLAFYIFINSVCTRAMHTRLVFLHVPQGFFVFVNPASRHRQVYLLFLRTTLKIVISSLFALRVGSDGVGTRSCIEYTTLHPAGVRYIFSVH